jgi:hypothetical protein
MRNQERILMPKQAYKFETNISPSGKVELTVPLPPGTPVEVFIVTPDVDEFQDLVSAADSSTAFWDNPLDDEDWNNA